MHFSPLLCGIASRICKFQTQEEVDHVLSQCAIPADVVSRGPHLCVTSDTSQKWFPSKAVEDWLKFFLSDVSMHIPVYNLKSTLLLGVGILLVSDACKKHGKGAYA